MKKREWLIAGAGLVTGIIVLLIWLSPRVTAVTPQELAAVREPITLRLSQPVQSESVPGRFKIDPPLEGQLRVEDDQIIYELDENLTYGRRYTATLKAGISGLNRLPLLRDTQWRFGVRPPRLLYLLEEDGVANLWLFDEEPHRLTDEPAGVWDYAPMADGSGIVYSALDQDGSLDLVLLTTEGGRRMLLDCVDSCRSPAPQPGGQLIAYERQPAGAGLEATELWLLDQESGETRPAPVPADLSEAGFTSPQGRYARWSPDGRKLATYRPDANLVVVQNLAAVAAGEARPAISIPANLETMAGWSPDGRRLAYTELAFGETRPHEHVDEAGTVISHTRPSLYNHVVLADVEARQAIDLSEGLELNEGRPAWHPNGRMLAVARTATGSGRQLWLVPLDGGQETQLTDDPFFDHTALAWSPDGRRLAFMRAPRADGGGTPTVMIYDLESEQIQPVAEAAFMPGWWP